MSPGPCSTRGDLLLDIPTYGHSTLSVPVCSTAQAYVDHCVRNPARGSVILQQSEGVRCVVCDSWHAQYPPRIRVSLSRDVIPQMPGSPVVPCGTPCQWRAVQQTQVPLNGLAAGSW